MENSNMNEKPKMNEKMQLLLKNKAMIWGLGALGVVLLFNPFSWMGGSQTPQTPAPPSTVETTVVNSARTAMAQYEQTYEQRLSEVLNTVRGVSDATVMVNIESSEETQFAEDMQENRQTTNETDKSGGTRTVTQFDKTGKLVMVKESGSDHPVVVKTIKPRVRGVLITAKGAEDVKIQAVIMEAVQRALEVPPHKISILPKKSS